MNTTSHDQLEVDALQTDRYLESLLLARERHASDSPSDASVDPAIRSTARRLAHDLSRVHPSFRFEERLAATLAEMAARMRLPAAAGDGGQVLAGPPPPDLLVLEPQVMGEPPSGGPGTDAPLSAGAGANLLPRPLIIGSAITSAALSIAGAAIVAWRLSHAGSTPMARAASAARAARTGRRRATARSGWPDGAHGSASRLD